MCLSLCFHRLSSLYNGSHATPDPVPEDDGGLMSPPLPLSPSHDGGVEGELTGRGAGGGRRKQPSERGYFIAKELLTTERTYGKDLEVVNGVGERGWEGRG